MGITQITATVRNPVYSGRKWEGQFIVDTGAIDSLVPKGILETIGLAPKGQREYTVADGSKTTLPFTTGDIEFMGETVGVTIIMGAEDAEPLLGVTALESAGIEVDPHNQELMKLSSIRLTGFRPAARSSTE